MAEQQDPGSRCADETAVNAQSCAVDSSLAEGQATEPEACTEPPRHMKGAEQDTRRAECQGQSSVASASRRCQLAQAGRPQARPPLANVQGKCDRQQDPLYGEAGVHQHVNPALERVRVAARWRPTDERSDHWQQHHDRAQQPSRYPHRQQHHPTGQPLSPRVRQCQRHGNRCAIE